MSLASLGLTEAQQREISEKLLLGCMCNGYSILSRLLVDVVCGGVKASLRYHPHARSLLGATSAPSTTPAAAPAPEAGPESAPTQVDLEVEDIKRSLSAQLEEAAAGVPQESGPQFGRGASVLGHAASFGETAGASTVLKAWCFLTAYIYVLYRS